MTAGQLKVAAGKDEQGLSACMHLIADGLKTVLRHAVDKFAPKWEGADDCQVDLYTMKSINGSQSTYNRQGLILEFRDAEGRAWSFRYRKGRIVEFTDPLARTWMKIDGRWRGRNRKGQSVAAEALCGIEVNQTNGEVAVLEYQRQMTYRPDGTTVLETAQIKDGQAVEIKFTEYSTRPNRAFVVVEKHADGAEYVIWIQDANGKLYQFEYEGGRLYRYTDVSVNPCIVWTARRNVQGELIGWSGRSREGKEVEREMTPQLQSVDSCGNRHFAQSDGGLFVVRPSGAALSLKAIQSLDCAPGFGGFGGMNRYYSTFSS